MTHQYLKIESKTTGTIATKMCEASSCRQQIQSMTDCPQLLHGHQSHTPSTVQGATQAHLDFRAIVSEEQLDGRCPPFL